MMSSNFLSPGQYLIYIINQKPFADVDGYTYIARKIRDYIQEGILWYDLNIETDADGDKLGTPIPITVSADRVLTERSPHSIYPSSFYYFGNPIRARSFVIKSNRKSPLESTSRNALGSGIYGRFEKDFAALDQEVYEINMENPYPIQDKEHGESLTVASLNTNRYLDRMLDSFNDDINMKTILERIKLNESPTLFTLWNIVFYRTYESISQDQLNTLFAEYLFDYLTNNSLVDSINGGPIHELPINRILRSLGYDGVIASDTYNNGWNRGCVSYNYPKIVQGDFARY